MEENNYDVSVVVLTYNPRADALFATLKSIIIQKNIKFQIVLSDDGSKNNLNSEIIEWFKLNNFSDYTLIMNEVNSGIVANLLTASQNCCGGFVKPISPGDLLFDENTLKLWYDNMVSNQSVCSFGDAVYYEKSGENFKLLSVTAFPKIIEPYIQNDYRRIRKNHLIFNDIIIGATVMYRRDILIKYLNIIFGKLKYGEDLMLKIMILDGLKFSYVNASVIYYEVGFGISTSGSQHWKAVFYNERDVLYQIMKERIKKDDYIYSLCIKQLKTESYRTSVKGKLMKLFISGYLPFKIRTMFFARKTNTDISIENLQSLYN